MYLVLLTKGHYYTTGAFHLLLYNPESLGAVRQALYRDKSERSESNILSWHQYISVSHQRR